MNVIKVQVIAEIKRRVADKGEKSQVTEDEELQALSITWEQAMAELKRRNKNLEIPQSEQPQDNSIGRSLEKGLEMLLLI